MACRTIEEDDRGKDRLETGQLGYFVGGKGKEQVKQDGPQAFFFSSSLFLAKLLLLLLILLNAVGTKKGRQREFKRFKTGCKCFGNLIFISKQCQSFTHIIVLVSF
jgi:hypothetical protein